MVNYYVISKNEKAVGQGGETLRGMRLHPARWRYGSAELHLRHIR